MKQVINADPHGKITLQGCDPVAFHTVGKAIKGDSTISTEYQGYKYLFSSEANKAMFDEQVEKYLPAYGGYCAFGVANNLLFPVEIDTWEVIDDRLVLQYSQDVKQMFSKNINENIQKANENWLKIQEGR